MVTQIEKLIDKRTKLRELLTCYIGQLVYETIPQFCLQLFIALQLESSGLISSDRLVESIRLILSSLGILVACGMSSVYSDFIASEIKPHVDVNQASFKKIPFLVFRFISNFLFISSRLISICVALTVSKLFVLLIISAHFLISFFVFYKYSLIQSRSFYTKLNQPDFEIEYLSQRFWQYILFASLKFFTFLEDIGSDIYCYLYHGIIWLEILAMISSFYFYSSNSYFKIYLFIYVCNCFLIGFLIETLLKKFAFNEKSSLILANLEAYFLNVNAFHTSTEYEHLQNDSLIFRV